MSALGFDLAEDDDLGFVHQLVPIVDGVLQVVEPVELYVVKIDTWFGANWFGFSHKIMGAVGVGYRDTLRVPPFVPARVRSQRFFRRAATGAYAQEAAPMALHVDQTSEANAGRLMSAVCPAAAVFWWSGASQQNKRGCVMAYLPGPEGHVGWYAELEKVAAWRLSRMRGTTAHELSTYVAGVAAAS